MSKSYATTFAKTLLQWHENIDRNLPWKESKDPYKIWLSEIILQQTRVAQGTPYYLRFIENFPTVADLANAEEDQVMKLWQGLGYYSRARNLHFAAKTIQDEFDGVFPNKYEDILSLKGVGKYTAAAISSFAFGERYPVVDGNVIRVISRYFGIADPVDHSQTLKKINDLAHKLIKGSDPAKYNQAIMDFGALHCRPKSPDCIHCPLQSDCQAYQKGIVDQIPLKAKKIKKRDRYFHYIHITDKEGKVLLRHRNKKDIWQSLYDFPCEERTKKGQLEEVEIRKIVHRLIGRAEHTITLPAKVYKHILTHQNIFGLFYKIEFAGLFPELEAFIAVGGESFEDYALPVLLTNYLSDQKKWTLF